MDNPLYVYFHIPRTGGTALNWHIGHQFDLEDDRYLKHYNFVANFSEWQYDVNKRPKLQNRNPEQQKKLKIITGHSTFEGIQYYLYHNRPNINYMACVRDPIERLLSSFNYRQQCTQLMQQDATFSTQMPVMSNNAVLYKKTAKDYNSLYEYYQDSIYEHNLQCKWLVKSFFIFDTDQHDWVTHKNYYHNTNTTIPQPDIIPDWFNWDDYRWYDFAESLLERIWWIFDHKDYNTSIKDFCGHAGLNYQDWAVEDNATGVYFDPYWTIEDVINQPDYEKLLQAEEHDIKLYEKIKTLKRPF